MCMHMNMHKNFEYSCEVILRTSLNLENKTYNLKKGY